MENSEQIREPVFIDDQRFIEMCMPIVEYLKKNGNMYTEVHISIDEIKVTSVECGIPLNEEAINHKD